MQCTHTRDVAATIFRIQPVQAPTLVLGLLIAATATSLTAQAAPVAFDDFRVPVHTAPADLGTAYGTWAGGSHYKVSFHDGMTFVPRLGRTYPHNLPVSWRTTSVRRGKAELLGAEERPKHGQAEYRYEYRYAAFTEAYDVEVEGIEQTFVFETLPGTGDLLITGRIDSELEADNVAPAHQSIAFRDGAGSELVRYGKAFAYDARGDTIELSSGHDSGEITLRVPSRWLAGASLPIVVDPFFTPRISVSGYLGGVPLEDVDVAYAPVVGGGRVMTVWSAAFSAIDVDVFGRVTDEDYGNGVTVFSDMTTSWVTDHPAAAFVAAADRWAIAFRRHFVNNPTTVSRIRVHVRDLSDLTPSSTYLPLSPTSGNDWRPDIGGVGTFSPGTDALIVFQREPNVGGFANVASSAVYGVLLDVSTPTGAFGSEFSIGSGFAADSERPSVNQVADGTALSWVCVYQTYNNLLPGDDWDLVGRRIADTGAVASGSWASDVASAGSLHQLRPVVEGTNGRYAVVFATYQPPFLSKTQNMAGTAVQIERFDWFHGANAPDPAGDQAPVVLESASTRIYQTLDLAADRRDGSHFAPLWREDEGGGFFEPRYAIVGYTGQPTEGPALASSGLIPSGAVTFGLGVDQYQMVLGNYGPSTAVLWGLRLEYNDPGPTALVGSGCATVNLRWAGNRQIGAELNRVYLLNAAAGTGHFMLVSLAPANVAIVDPAVQPGCFLLVDNGQGFLGTLDFKVAQGGISPDWRFALPEWLPPLTLYFQDWVFDGSTFASTKRLEVPVIR